MADQTPDDIEVRGHKVFVTRQGDWIEMQAVNDDQPHVSMTFRLGVEDAEEIVTLLREAIDGCPVCGATFDTDAELQEHFDVC